MNLATSWVCSRLTLPSPHSRARFPCKSCAASAPERPELCEVPLGFGLRQSSGAFGQDRSVRKRQRTAALQDAVALAYSDNDFSITHWGHEPHVPGQRTRPTTL